MRILATADTVGGVWVYALELARALAPHGVEVALATMGAPPSADQRRELATLDNVELHESTFRLEWMQDPWLDVDRAGDWLLALEQRVRPDVVHLNGFVHGALPWTAPVLVVGHSCVRSWWQGVYGRTPPSEWDEYTTRVRAGLASADLVAAPSHAMLRALVRHYGSFVDTDVIPNGRDGTRFRPGHKESLIFAAGRLWDEAKNVAALCRVAQSLPWPAYVAGSKRSPDGAEPDVEHVHALGVLPANELAEWLGRASIYAFPARYEPFGLSVLEAALSGCTLVLGGIESLREIWGDAAAYVDPMDDDQLARTLQWMCDDASLRRALAARARTRALELTPALMAERYLAAYNRLRHAHMNGEVAACAS